MSVIQMVKLAMEFGLVPLIWGGVVLGVHHLGWVRAGRIPSDRIEKAFLGILLLPYGLGLGLWGLYSLLPNKTPILPPLLPETILHTSAAIAPTKATIPSVAQGADFLSLTIIAMLVMVILIVMVSVIKIL